MHSQVLVRSLFLAYRCLSSRRVLTWWREKASSLLFFLQELWFHHEDATFLDLSQP